MFLRASVDLFMLSVADFPSLIPDTRSFTLERAPVINPFILVKPSPIVDTFALNASILALAASKLNPASVSDFLIAARNLEKLGIILDTAFLIPLSLARKGLVLIEVNTWLIVCLNVLKVETALELKAITEFFATLNVALIVGATLGNLVLNALTASIAFCFATVPNVITEFFATLNVDLTAGTILGNVLLITLPTETNERFTTSVTLFK